MNRPSWMPGPWTPNAEGIIDATGDQVCEFYGRSQPINRDLISAAPELYDALQALLAEFEPLANLDPSSWSNHPEVCKQARAALAKANGVPAPPSTKPTVRLRRRASP